MHEAAHDWVRRYATAQPISVLDLGGRDINGSVRDLYPNAYNYTVLDIIPGDNVQIVADAATWEPFMEYDVVVCTEVFEHTKSWPEICVTAWKALNRGGHFIVTCGAPGRSPHSALDGGVLTPGEYYGNVSAADLGIVLMSLGFEDIHTEEINLDARAIARKGRARG